MLKGKKTISSTVYSILINNVAVQRDYSRQLVIAEAESRVYIGRRSRQGRAGR